MMKIRFANDCRRSRLSLSCTDSPPGTENINLISSSRCNRVMIAAVVACVMCTIVQSGVMVQGQSWSNVSLNNDTFQFPLSILSCFDVNHCMASILTSQQNMYIPMFLQTSDGFQSYDTLSVPACANATGVVVPPVVYLDEDDVFVPTGNGALGSYKVCDVYSSDGGSTYLSSSHQPFQPLGEAMIWTDTFAGPMGANAIAMIGALEDAASTQVLGVSYDLGKSVQLMKLPKQTTPTTNNYYMCAAFPSDTTWYVLGFTWMQQILPHLVVLKTTDAGETFTPLQTSQLAGQLYIDIACFDINTCYISGWVDTGCYIYNTTDGGQTWNQFAYYPTQSTAIQLQAVGNSTLIAVVSQSVYQYSLVTNEWSLHSEISDATSIDTIQFFDINTAYAMVTPSIPRTFYPSVLMKFE